MDGGCEHRVQYQAHGGHAENAIVCTSLLSPDSGFSEKSGASVHAAADENNWRSSIHPARWPLVTCGVVWKGEKDDTDSACRA